MYNHVHVAVFADQSIEYIYRMPWQKLHNGVAATEDEEVFQSLAHAFADNYPEIYQPDACKTSPNHGIFHGADLHSQTYSLMDDMYINGHSYMVHEFLFQLLNNFWQ